MLTRVDDWFKFLNISDKATARGQSLALETLGPSAGMMVQADLDALAAALLHLRPDRIFEIGTYMGASSNFFLSLLPKAKVISIAYIPPEQLENPVRYNNIELGLDQVGSLVSDENRPRFTQMIGDSHAIVAKDFIAQYGRMDFVFIDGDHSRKGVAQDTDLAKAILSAEGGIGWHDANPKPKYIQSREFLEQDLDLNALATADIGIGGVAFWTKKLEKKIQRKA